MVTTRLRTRSAVARHGPPTNEIRSRGKRRGFSPGAAARHSQSARAHTDYFVLGGFYFFFPSNPETFHVRLAKKTKKAGNLLFLKSEHAPFPFKKQLGNSLFLIILTCLISIKTDVEIHLFLESGHASFPSKQIWKSTFSEIRTCPISIKTDVEIHRLDMLSFFF